MSADRLKEVVVSEIHIRDDIANRAVHEDTVAGLMESISIEGLISPIRVRPIGIFKSGQRYAEWELVAGRHRLEAVRRLGWSRIDASIEALSDNMAELAMIDENLARKDLEPCEAAYFVYRRKVLHEAEFGKAKAIGAHAANAAMGKGDANGIMPFASFTSITAERSGKSLTVVQRLAQIGEKLEKDALKLVGTSLNSFTELYALQALEPDERDTLIDRAIAGEQVSAKDAKSSKPKTKKPPKPTKVDAPSQPENLPVIIDLTSPEAESELIAVGEAAADAGFFPKAASGDANHPRGVDDYEQRSGSRPATTPTDGTLTNSISETLAASEAEARAVEQEKKALFLRILELPRIFEGMDVELQEEFAREYDLSEFISKYQRLRSGAMSKAT